MYSNRITSHRELDVYKLSFNAAMKLFEISKGFPREEQYSLTDQIRRSSRSVCANIAEAFRKRKDPKAFVSKLSDAESEAAETQNWLDFSFKCHYICAEDYKNLNEEYDHIIGKLVNMSLHPEKWNIDHVLSITQSPLHTFSQSQLPGPLIVTYYCGSYHDNCHYNEC